MATIRNYRQVNVTDPMLTNTTKKAHDWLVANGYLDAVPSQFHGNPQVMRTFFWGEGSTQLTVWDGTWRTTTDGSLG